MLFSAAIDGVGKKCSFWQCGRRQTCGMQCHQRRAPAIDGGRADLLDKAGSADDVHKRARNGPGRGTEGQPQSTVFLQTAGCGILVLVG